MAFVRVPLRQTTQTAMSVYPEPPNLLCVASNDDQYMYQVYDDAVHRMKEEIEEATRAIRQHYQPIIDREEETIRESSLHMWRVLKYASIWSPNTFALENPDLRKLGLKHRVLFTASNLHEDEIQNAKTFVQHVIDNPGHLSNNKDEFTLLTLSDGTTLRTFAKGHMPSNPAKHEFVLRLDAHTKMGKENLGDENAYLHSFHSFHISQRCLILLLNSLLIINLEHGLKKHAVDCT